MKRKFLVLILFVFCGLILPLSPENKTEAEESAKMAIVIDDFGEDRRGVEEMLNLKVPLTIAVMPSGEFTTEDATRANEFGHEVILHMPMENQNPMPANYYGPTLIKNSHTPTEAKQIINKAIDCVPHCKGVNIHMGTGVSRNPELITAIMEEVNAKDLYFLDSRTIEGSVCDECAKTTGVKFFGRDVFLEPPGRPSYQTAKQELNRAIELAKTNGQVVVIGHVGPVGEDQTAKAIADTIPEIEKQGIKLVKLSELTPIK